MVIDKQPKPTVDRQSESNSTNAKQSQKTLIPIAQPISVGDADDGNSLDFTQFLGGKDVSLNDLELNIRNQIEKRTTTKMQIWFFIHRSI